MLVLRRSDSRSQRTFSEEDTGADGYVRLGVWTMSVEEGSVGRAVDAPAAVPNFTLGIHHLFNK